MSFNIYTAKELLERDVQEVPMLVEGVFPKVGLVALAGSSDTGKSALLRSLAISICVGKTEFIGYRLNTEKNGVTYVSTEDDDSAIAALLKKQAAPESPSPEAMEKLHFIVGADPKTFQVELDTHLRDNGTDVVIIDAISDLITGDINNLSTVRPYLNVLNNLASKHKCLFILLHHLKKGVDEMEASKNHLSGSQGLEAKMRSVVVLKKTDGYRSPKRSLQVVKGNYSSSEIKNKKVILIFDEESLTFTKVGESVLEERKPVVPLSLGDINLIKGLSSKGMSIREIADHMTNKGTPIGKTKVWEILKE